MAVFDCRHMACPGFWEQTVLHFFREADDGQVHLQPHVKYCQVPQSFVGVELASDYLDVQNEYGFRFVNCMRDGVGAVTSCGTNCVWAIERGFEYEEKTMIVDTATSHKVILQGYEGTYHYEKLAFGVPEGNKGFWRKRFAGLVAQCSCSGLSQQVEVAVVVGMGVQVVVSQRRRSRRSLRTS